MTAVVWTLVGVLSGTFGLLSAALFMRIGRIDGLRFEFSGRFDGLHDDMRELRTEMRDVRGTLTGLDRRLTSAGG
jgi:hypothetical protein